MKELTDDDKRSMSKAGIDIYNAIRDKKIEEEKKVPSDNVEEV